MRIRSIGIGLALVGVAIVLFGAACGGGDDDSSSLTTWTQEGISMEPNVVHEQQVNVRAYDDEEPARGDIVFFKAPTEPSDVPERFFLKRVIGMPGETIEVRDLELLIDGEPVDEPYILEATRYTFELTTIPAEHYFVLGDNRNNSSDSHTFGAVPAENITGYVVN